MRLAIGTSLLLPLTVAAFARAQEPASCTLEGKVYHCNWSAFRDVFRTANTVAVEGHDHAADRQLREFAAGMNKTVVAGRAQDANLIMVVVPVNSGGVTIGPADVGLATLQIYGQGSGTDRGPLLWSETLMGQPDLPWPSQVHLLLGQFKDRFAAARR